MDYRSACLKVSAFAVLAVAAAGCGEEKGGDVTTSTATGATGAAQSTGATGATSGTGETGATSASGGSDATAATGGTSTSAEIGDVDIEISADPTGRLRFKPVRIIAGAGKHRLVFTNESNTRHDVVVGKGFTESGRVAATDKIVNSVTSTEIDLKPGTYTYFCDISGHRRGGMVGALLVR